MEGTSSMWRLIVVDLPVLHIASSERELGCVVCSK